MEQFVIFIYGVAATTFAVCVYNSWKQRKAKREADKYEDRKAFEKLEYRVDGIRDIYKDLARRLTALEEKN